MNKKLKFILIAVTGITSFTILLVVNFNLTYNSINQPKDSVFNITLIVDYNNDTIRFHENFTLDNEKTTAFDALDKWCDIKTIDYSWGIFVSEIDGISGNWIYMVNNNTPFVAAPKYHLDNGDEVKWLIKEIF